MTKKTILEFENFLNSYQDRKAASLRAEKFFPVYEKDKLNEEYAYLIGKVMGDGNLDEKFTTRFIGKEEDLILLRNLINKSFGVPMDSFSIRVRESMGTSHLLQVNCAWLGRILSLLGAPVGNKTKKRFSIPSWIIKEKQLKRRFLQALLEDELTTIKIEKSSYSVKPFLKLAKRKKYTKNLISFMEQIKAMIESFGIDCSHLSSPRSANECNEIYFSIKRNKNNILKFRKEIGFRLNKEKTKQLEKCCSVLKTTLKR